MHSAGRLAIRNNHQSLNTFDVFILGAGIAGLSTADALLQRGFSCAIADICAPGSGASGAPLMLINPATGRRARMAWRAGDCMHAALDLMKRVQKYSGEHFFEKTGVIRPAPTRQIAEDFKKSPEKYEWPQKNWIEWMPAELFARKYPAVHAPFGGLVVKQAITVQGNVYMRLLSDYLIQAGLHTCYNSRVDLRKSDNVWFAKSENGETVRAKKIVFATGRHIPESPWWQFLPLSLIKGQTATFHFREKLPVDCSVSGFGYMAWFSEQPGQLVVGSTYERDYISVKPDQQGEDLLREKLNQVLPGWSEKIVTTDRWASVRVGTKDHNPVTGEHPEVKGLYILTGFGSKGMIAGRFVAEQLANLIADGNSIDAEVTVARFS